MNQARMKATTSIMNSNHILLLFCILCLQISTETPHCPAGLLKHGDKCCRPVLHCPSGHYVKTCERNGFCDECLPCPSGTENPYITSSFDVKKCYKNNCPTDAFRISEDKCKCALHRSHIGKNEYFCQAVQITCQQGKELTNQGKCEDCENNHYKYWVGQGYCIKDIDCSLIGLFKIAGNLTTPTTCPNFEDKCSPKVRVPPLPTTTTTSPSVPVMATVRRIRQRLSTQKTTKGSKSTAAISPMAEKPQRTTMDYVKTTNLMDRKNALDLFKVHYIYVTVICLLVIIIILLLIIYIMTTKYKSKKKEKRQVNNNYQEIGYLRKVSSPNDKQRPLPKTPSSNDLIDTYMEMGKSSRSVKSPVPYFISSPYSPSTLTRLIQQPGEEIPLFHPVYQQNIESMMRFTQYSTPRQESSASGEEEYNALSLQSSPSMRDCSMSSETALKVPDTGEPNPNRVETTGVEPLRIQPLGGDFDPVYQDAISIHTTSNYSPPIHCIQPAQVTQTGIVHPQVVHYT